MLSLLSAIFSAQAQNLVPNPGFELINRCPDSGLNSVPILPLASNYPFVQSWSAYSNAWYFNTCVDTASSNPYSYLNAFKSVPDNIFGHRAAHNGNAYAGIMIGIPPSLLSMCVQARLTAPLEANEWYCVSFYVSLAVRHTPHPNGQGISYSSGKASDRLGAYFSVTHPGGDTFNIAQFLNVIPQVVNPTWHWLNDTSGWVRVNGIFRASGGEEWITISNFDSLPHLQAINYPAAISLNQAMYYIDDVNVNKITVGSGPQHNPAPGTQDTAICSNLPLNKALYAPPGADTYLWSNGATSDSINITNGGQYWYQAVYNGCGVISDTIIISYNPLQHLELQNDTALCSGSSLSLAANDAFNAYQWNTGATTPEITVDTSGVYRLTVATACGPQTDSVQVTFYPLPEPPAINDTAICQFSDPLLIGAGVPLLNWYQQPSGGSATPAPVLSTDKAGRYRLFVSRRSEQGCESRRIPLTIDVLEPPSLELGKDTVFCPGSPPLIGVIPSEDTSVRFLWNNGEQGPTLVPGASGTYSLKVSNVCGIMTDSIKVRLDACLDCAWIPGAFSPNNDGSNDEFGAFVKCPLDSYSLLIFNRWGQKIFESHQPANKWDGKNCDVGTYFYLLTYKNKNSLEPIVKKGDVSLVR